MKNRVLIYLMPLWFCLHLASLIAIFFIAPEEATQGIVQKIFYFHVASALSMYIGFGIAGLGALLYLIYRNNFWDDLSHAGGTVGLLFCSMVLISGPLWARPIWGTWWTWDPRLTTTLMIWLVFAAIELLRQSFEKDQRGSLFASILTLLGILDLPLIFLSVKLWRGIHPQVLGQESSMPPSMRLALILAMLSFIFLSILLITITFKVYRLERRKIWIT